MVDFGYVQELQFSQPATVTVTNDGSSSVDVTGPDWHAEGDFTAFDFQLVPASDPFTLGEGGTEEFSVFFSPPGAGTFVAWVTLTVDGETLLVPVGGCSGDEDCVVDFGDPPGDDDDDDAADDDDGAPDDDDGAPDDDDGGTDPDIAVETTINFGDVAANQSAIGDVLQISNVGGADLEVTALDLAGADASFFSVTGWNGGTIAPGGAPVNLNVAFDPYNAPTGPKTATLTIESNDPDEGTVDVALSANVVEDCLGCPAELEIVGAEVVDLFIAQIYYLQVSTGTVEITIQNTGTGILNVEPVTTGGQYCTDNPAIELISGPSTIGAGESATQTWSVGQAGLEVVNFNGTYAFTFGTYAGAEIMTEVMAGTITNCAFL
jgi:archaellum component FlaF (FlaF/FlaG flagellin family)